MQRPTICRPPHVGGRPDLGWFCMFLFWMFSFQARHAFLGVACFFFCVCFRSWKNSLGSWKTEELATWGMVFTLKAWSKGFLPKTVNFLVSYQSCLLNLWMNLQRKPLDPTKSFFKALQKTKSTNLSTQQGSLTLSKDLQGSPKRLHPKRLSKRRTSGEASEVRFMYYSPEALGRLFGFCLVVSWFCFCLTCGIQQKQMAWCLKRATVH